MTISSSDDAYRQLVVESQEDWLYGLVAFAVIEEARIEWSIHREEIDGQAPNADEIRDWYENQAQSVLVRAKGDAEIVLAQYGQEVLTEEGEAERKEIMEGLIVSEIRMTRNFWREFGTNVAGGFVSAMLFALLLAIMVFVVLTDVSPEKLGRSLFDSTQPQVNQNGETETK